MYIVILIFINFFSITLQAVQAGIFCDNYLREIYLIDEESKTEKVIANGWEGEWPTPYMFEELNADPGSLIKFKCYSYNGWSFGAGCFLINDKCYCYMFDSEIKEYSDKIEPYKGKVNFNNNKTCSISVKFLNEFNISKDYYYEHYIPLDVNQIECINNKYISVPKNVEYVLTLSDYVKSSFKLTNLKITINENYKYFTLNKEKLSSNKKFKIISNLTFFHNEHTKIKIKFKNYGVFIKDTKQCELGIRVCYDSCLECKDKDPDNNNHQCIKCQNEYYFIENTNNCLTKKQMENTNYYFDENDKIFKKCYSDCLHCKGEGDSNDMKCIDCKPPKYYAEPNNCIDNITNYYFDENDKIFKKCYSDCLHCKGEGDSNDMKCIDCKPPKYYAEPNNCINNITNYYYSEENKKYIKCYKTCESCNENSNEKAHNCKKCNDDYHFIYNEDGKCISSDEKPTNTYLDIITNTYNKCNDSCYTCDSLDNCIECNKDESNNYIYHFIENEKGKCISESELDTLSIIDENDNTYKLCPKGTIKVENNKCISRSAIYLVLFIIIIIIIILLFICLIWRLIRKKKTFNINEESKEMIRLI